MTIQETQETKLKKSKKSKLTKVFLTHGEEVIFWPFFNMYLLWSVFALQVFFREPNISFPPNELKIRLR